MASADEQEKPVMRLSVAGMRCAGCVAGVETALQGVAGVESAEVNFADHSARVQGKVEFASLKQAMQDAGYDAALMEALEDVGAEEAMERQRFRSLLMKAAVAAALGFPLMVGSHFGWFPAYSDPGGKHFWSFVSVLTMAVIYYSGRHFYISAFKLLEKRQSNMDTLIALGTGAAWSYSTLAIDISSILPHDAGHAYFEAATTILAFINLGSALEMRARGKTSAAIRQLIGLQPRSARVVRDGVELDVDIASIGLEEILRVRPGEKIAVDGVVLEGHSNIDESMLTGESMPVSKQAGDELIAGTLNQGGTLLYKATHIGRDTVLARIVESVRQAQGSKPALARIADRIAAVFVPVVVAISAFTFLVWLIFGPSPSLGYAFVTSMTVLIIACPCALGLATPISVMVAVGRAAQKGILIRNGDALQSAGKLTCVVLDKTGTVTQGRPSVAGIHPAPGSQEEMVLVLAASLEAGSEHPLGAAIVAEAHNRGLALEKVEHFEALSGRGVVGIVRDRNVALGNAKLMQERNVDFSALWPILNQCANLGQTPILLAVDQQIAGVVSVADSIKADSKRAIDELKAQGVRVLMVTGDNEITAHAIAREAGIDEIRAQVMPEDKAAIIKALQAQGLLVGMVGDGINDAPALAQADVGFAMGTGTDIAIESGDVVIMRGSLLKIADAMHLSRLTVENIHQNFFGAFIYNVLSIPVAAGILYPAFGLLLNPIIAGAAMALSSVTVVTNANRLRWK